MADATREKEGITLLQTVYKSIRSQTNLILDLMPRVRNEALKSDMTVALSAYEAFASRAAKRLSEEGTKPVEDSMLDKMGAKWSTVKETLRDRSEGNVAKLLAQSAKTSAEELKKELREAENSTVSEASLRLIRDLCAFEEKNAEDLKQYLL